MFDVPSCSCHIPSLPQYLNNPHVRPLGKAPPNSQGVEPSAVRSCFSRWASSADGTQTAPPSASEWPARDLVGGVHHSIYTQQQRPLQGWWCKTSGNRER